MDILYHKLKDCCSKIGSGATPKGGKSVYTDEGVSLIRSQNVYNLIFSYKGLAHITDEAAKKLSGVTIQENDVLLNITGDSVARTCIVPNDVLPARVNQHVAIIRPNKSLDPTFLNYYLASPAMQGYLLNIASTGASRNAITKAAIEKLIIPAPKIDEQHKIASLLSSYNNLIENNNKRIKILEQMAENLYKEWFVRFRFPGHETTPIENGIPKSWNECRLGDCMLFNRGTSYSSEDIVDGDLALLSMNNIRPYGGYIADYSRSFSGKYKTEQIVHENDLIMSITDMTQDRRIIGYVGLVGPTEKKCVICTHLMKISSLVYHNYFLHGLFTFSGLSKSVSEQATGTNVLGLTAKILNKIKCVIPEIKLTNLYSQKVAPIFEEIHSIEKQNENLIKQRDLLLPRLMSGKLAV